LSETRTLPYCGTADPERPPSKDCPESTLPTKGVLSASSTLPWCGTDSAEHPRSEDCPDKRKTGDEKGPIEDRTEVEEILKEFALFVGAVNLQLDADLNRPDGKKSGVPIGQNPDGPDHPLIQAVVSLAQFPKAIQAPARAFMRKVNRSIAKKTTAVIAANELSEEVAGALANAGKPLGADAMAQALRNAGTIGPYARWAQFTAGSGGKLQAHHILEKQWFKEGGLFKGDPDLVPSVILSDAEHKVINGKLASWRPKIHTLDDLWAAYKDVYKNNPAWLDAIKSYFPNAK
jgi:hypothetical protein